MAALLLLAALLLAPRAQTVEPSAPTPQAQPIRSSVDRIVAKIDKDRNEPCHMAVDAGLPCYPTSTEAHGPVYRVRDSLSVDPGSSHGASAPQLFPPPAPGGFTLGPVCLVKSAVKTLKGKNDVYYLYRVKLPQGEHVEMRETRVDPMAYQGTVEFLGRFSGECEAIAAYRWAERLSNHPADKTQAAGPPAH
ncbi:MAG: hypothetical protein ACHQNV_04060 [Vicinamibacteria bacterium]